MAYFILKIQLNIIHLYVGIYYTRIIDEYVFVY